MRKSLWSPDEDEKLKHYVAKHGCGNWSDVAKHTGLKRCGKSCRLRWINYLRPDLKRGPFTPDEIRLIVNLHRDLGNSWSRIATYLPGRTDNDVKNFWHSYTRSKRMQTLPPAAINTTGASKSQPGKPSATLQQVSNKSSPATEPPASNQMKLPANSTAQLGTALQPSRSLADSMTEKSVQIKPSADHYSGLVLLNDVQVCPTDTSADHQLGEVEEVIDCGHIDYDRQYHDHGHVLISQVSNYPVPSALMSTIDHLHDQYNGSCGNDGINLPSLCFAVHEQYGTESEHQYSTDPPEDLQSVLWSFMQRSNYRQAALNVLPSPCCYSSSSSSASHSSGSSGNSCSSDRKPAANYLKHHSGDNHEVVASNHAVLHTAPYAMLVDFS